MRCSGEAFLKLVLLDLKHKCMTQCLLNGLCLLTVTEAFCFQNWGST